MHFSRIGIFQKMPEYIAHIEQSYEFSIDMILSNVISESNSESDKLNIIPSIKFHQHRLVFSISKHSLP